MLGKRIGKGARRRVDRLVGQLEGAPAAMLRRDLIDPAALAVAKTAEKEAAELKGERTTLLEQVHAEALMVEPSELDAIADTLEATGFFGRLGGHYRATMRQAARLLISVQNRMDAATTLHRAASLVRSTRDFEQGHKARQLFPALLWEGVDSD